jgi:Zn-dependent M28 family amino/carboxypeptidase
MIAVCLAPFIATMPAHADPNNNSVAKLTNAVTVDGVFRHLEQFQQIADANGGDRAAGRPGYRSSVDYVAGQLRGAGYDVTVQEFPFEYSEALLAQISPDPAQYVDGEDFRANGFTPVATGDATGVLQRVGEGDATPGCDAADFAGFTAGNIALVQRGACPFVVKAQNAKAAGATGVVLFNNVPDLLLRAIGDAPGLGIPVVFTTQQLGLALSAGGPRTVRVQVVSESRPAYNVLAQSREGRADNVVMAGAHLDSVQAGPGINDNGSGSAALLETALQMAKVKTNSQVRFAWWGAEESGLVGSNFYVANLSKAQRDAIALYLNFDMIGSPNYTFGIYDGDNSSGTATVPIPPGSAQIEDVFEKFFADRGQPFVDSEFTARSDYQAFILAGIPAGGLFTGAEVPKTATEAQIFGGVAGAQLDPCYHAPCDSLSPVKDGADAALYAQLQNLRGNVNTVALDVNSDALAASVITFAFDTSAVNGVRVPGKSHGSANDKVGTVDPGGVRRETA